MVSRRKTISLWGLLSRNPVPRIGTDLFGNLTVDIVIRSNRTQDDVKNRILIEVRDLNGEVLSLLDNETGMHSCLESKPRSPGGTGGKRRHPRAYENTGIRADEPEAR